MGSPVSEGNIDQLFAATLSGDYDDEEPWEAIRVLRRDIGTRPVFERAAEWCRSDDPLKRARGADVLAQLGKTVGHPTNSFPEESYATVVALVEREGDPQPLSSGIHALGHLDNPEAVPLVSRFGRHPIAEVRFAVACALGSYPNDPLSVTNLLELTRDSDADVRDWATFGLGVQGDCDTPEIREALFRCLEDQNEDVREEAMVGLAKRKDRRVLPILLQSLEQPSVTMRVTEAASLILGMDSEPEGWAAHNYISALRKHFPSSTEGLP